VYATSDFNKAEQLYKESISINSKPQHDINDALITQSHLANLYFDKQEFDKGFAVLSAVKKGLDTIKNTDIETEWNRLMWKYYDHEKELNEAYTYLNKYENLKAKNTTANENFKGSITDVFDNLQSQYEISLLTKNEKVNSLYMILLLGGLVLFSVIILLVWYNWRKSLKYVKVLQEYTRQINNQKLALEKTLEIVENQNKEKDSILRVVAHDLRNPINGIVSLLSIIKETPESNEHGELLKIMETACFDALNMITGILEASEALSGKQKTSLLSITQIVEHTVQLLHYKAEEKGQHINIFSPKNDLVILGNEEQLRRVLSNLITNAVKFSPTGSDINIKILEHNDSVEIMVEDKGIGIPGHLKDKVFNVFTEAKRYGTQNEKPFGLGLSICKQIIENHNGQIWFTSEEGNGTIFHVMLPKK
jgi:signal transduction histidine kinase